MVYWKLKGYAIALGAIFKRIKDDYKQINRRASQGWNPSCH